MMLSALPEGGYPQSSEVAVRLEGSRESTPRGFRLKLIEKSPWRWYLPLLVTPFAHAMPMRVHFLHETRKSTAYTIHIGPKVVRKIAFSFLLPASAVNRGIHRVTLSWQIDRLSALMRNEKLPSVSSTRSRYSTLLSFTMFTLLRKRPAPQPPVFLTDIPVSENRWDWHDDRRKRHFCHDERQELLSINRHIKSIRRMFPLTWRWAAWKRRVKNEADTGGQVNGEEWACGSIICRDEQNSKEILVLRNIVSIKALVRTLNT